MSALGSGSSAAMAKLSTTDVVRAQLRGKRVRLGETAVTILLLSTLLIALAVLVLLMVDIVRTAWPVISTRPGSFITSTNSTFPETAGIKQALIGSLLMMVFVVVLAFPLGIGAAVYLEEYAKDTRFTQFLQTNIRNLAGVPSIVYGLLGLAIFCDFLSKLTGGFTLLSGGLTLAILVLPIVIITASEALRAVPQSIREAGFGVGATQWEVIRSHVVPSAAPGILTGTVLTVARAFGEAAPLLLVGAVTGFFSSGGASFLEQIRQNHGYTALPIIIFSWARLPNVDFRALTAAAIVVLLIVLLTMNATAIILRNRYERTW
ncbi:MAG TPA: phosphate ABC transporter permease PstA [Actinomycetota bacterium]|nr:phosphate ABC transporter permease PstA [Actinomycetota bacterium]